MRLYGSVWRKRMALVAIKLIRSRHASAQDEEIAWDIKWRLRPRKAWEQ